MHCFIFYDCSFIIYLYISFQFLWQNTLGNKLERRTDLCQLAVSCCLVSLLLGLRWLLTSRWTFQEEKVCSPLGNWEKRKEKGKSGIPISPGGVACSDLTCFFRPHFWKFHYLPITPQVGVQSFKHMTLENI